MTEPVLDAQAQDTTRQAGYDRPVSPSNQSRSVVIAKNGMVATSHPLAAQAGLDVLKSGGNAVDAAIAVNAMLGVVEPMSNGIGGDLFCIYWDNKQKKLFGLNASGRSPHKATREYFAEHGHKQIPLFGPLSWSVPGCVSVAGRPLTIVLDRWLSKSSSTVDSHVAEAVSRFLKSLLITGKSPLRHSPNTLARQKHIN